VDLLRQVRFNGGLDLAPLLCRAEGDATRCMVPRNDRVEEVEPIEEALLRAATPVLAEGGRFYAEGHIRNSDRTVGARISGEIALRWGGCGLPPGSVDLHFTGAAGQSFGAFAGPGLRLDLTGEANDYVGKGLCGAELILRPAGAARHAPHHNVILGNVALYGATSGRLFAAGTAGERFAVRNSGACAVVEGAGDHACEYMTGGVVAVLGATGVNFGAGMTGGSALVYDEEDALPARLNAASVSCARPGEDDLALLRSLIAEHVDHTQSVHAGRLLDNWEDTSARIWKVAPK
jgi:glutamate synthase domain-containing protein 3